MYLPMTVASSFYRAIRGEKLKPSGRLHLASRDGDIGNASKVKAMPFGFESLRGLYCSNYNYFYFEVDSCVFEFGNILGR